MSFMGQKNEDEDDDGDDDDKSSENVESLEKHESLSQPLSLREHEAAEGDVEERKVETLKIEERQDESSEKNNLVSEKSVETDIALSEEAESIVEKTIIGIFEEATAIAMEQSEPSVDHGSLKDSGSTEHKSTSSQDQVTVTVPESNEVDVNLELQKTENELKKQEEETTQEVSTVEARSVTSDDASEMVLNESNINDKVDIEEQVTSEHQADIKEQEVSSERKLSDDGDSVVELEKVKKEMKLMETALLGAARQAQVHKVLPLVYDVLVLAFFIT